MNKIEVTKQTFFAIFNSPDDFMNREQKETHEINDYYNVDLDQRGEHIFNYVSSREGNFYLIDINA